MKLLNIEEYIKENPSKFDGSNIYQDISNEQIKDYSEYLGENISQIIEHSDYLASKIEEHMEYLEFIQRPEDIPLVEWMKIKNDPIELKRIKRERTIDEIIK